MSDCNERISEAMKGIRLMEKCIDNMLFMPKILNNALYDALNAVCAEANSKWGFEDGIVLKPHALLQYKSGESNPTWLVEIGVRLLIPKDIAGCKTTWLIGDEDRWHTIEEHKDNIRLLEDEVDGLRLRLDPEHGTKEIRDTLKETIDDYRRRVYGTRE